MQIGIYQVDAFAVQPFTGNPASVCALPRWLPDALLQQIAAENNQAETAFLVPADQAYEIRWFTPTVEVDLCGHATLAAAHVLFTRGGAAADTVEFRSARSGRLLVSREGEELVLDFPADTLVSVPPPPALVQGLGSRPIEAWRGRTDYLFVYRHQGDISGLSPDLQQVAAVECRGVIVTAPGLEADFVSRFFAPRSGIPEDPVTGSAHTTLTQYWAPRLHKSELTAIQLSPRGGRLRCRLANGRVRIAGRARLYMSGRIYIEAD